MINTTGLSQYAIISALEYASGRKLWYLPPLRRAARG